MVFWLVVYGSFPALMRAASQPSCKDSGCFFSCYGGRETVKQHECLVGHRGSLGYSWAQLMVLPAARSTSWTKPNNHFFPDRLVTAAAHSEILQPDENWRGRDKSLTPFWPFLALYLLKILITWLAMVNKETDQPLHFKQAACAKQALHHHNRKFFLWPANAMTQ